MADEVQAGAPGPTNRAAATPLEEALWKEITTVDDPELGFSIVELGLVYDVKVNEAGKADVTMTFTSMACPAGPQLKGGVYSACMRVDGVEDAEVEVVFTPPWDPREMASEEIQDVMGIY